MRHDSSPSPERSIHTKITDKVEAIANIPHTVLERFHANSKQIHEKYRLITDQKKQEQDALRIEGEKLRSLMNKLPKGAEMPVALKKAQEKHSNNVKALQEEMIGLGGRKQKELDENAKKFREEVSKKNLRDDSIERKKSSDVSELPELELVKREGINFEKLQHEVDQAAKKAEEDDEYASFSTSENSDKQDERGLSESEDTLQRMKWEDILKPSTQNVPRITELVNASTLSKQAIAAERKKRADDFDAQIDAAVDAAKPAALTVRDIRRAETLQDDLVKAEALKNLKKVSDREIDAAVSVPGTSDGMRPSEKLIAKKINRITVGAEADAAIPARLEHVDLSPQEKVALIKEHGDIVSAQDKALADAEKSRAPMADLLRKARQKDIQNYYQTQRTRDRKAATTDLRDSLRMPRSAQKDKPYLDAAVANPGAFDQLTRDQLAARDKNLAYDVRFPGTKLSFRSGEYVKLPSVNGKSEAVQLATVPEIVYDSAGKENGMKFTYVRTNGSTETKTYYAPLEKVSANEIQSIYRAGDVVRIPRGTSFEMAILSDQPRLNTEDHTGETAYIYTYKKTDGTTETKAYYEPLQKVERRFSEEDVAKFKERDLVELVVGGKKINVYLTEKPRVELDENGNQKILFTYDLGNGVSGTHFADTLPELPLKRIEEAAAESGVKASEAEQAYIDSLSDLTKDAVAEPYPELELGDLSFQYAFGDYILYESNGRWNIGSVQAEPRRIPSAAKVEFTVQNARTGEIERFSVEKPPKIFKPLESKKVTVNGIDYTIEGGHIGLNGEVEYQLLSRRNEVVPNVDIETIRNLQSAEKLSVQMKERINAIESRIKDLSTNKVRELMLSFNDLQLRMQKLNADFGQPRDWNDLGKDEVKDMERTIKKFRHELDLSLGRLEDAVREQSALFDKQKIIASHKELLAKVEKRMARMGMTKELKQRNPQEYMRLLEELYQSLTEDPGNALHEAVKKRIADKVNETDVDETFDLQNFEERALEEVMDEWRKEKADVPALDFKKEYEGGKGPDGVEYGLLPKYKQLKEKIAKLEETNKEKYDKVAELFFAAERAFDQVKENDPKLPLALLKAWQAFGKLEVALAGLESVGRKEKRKEGKLEKVELPTRVLYEMLSARPAEMRRVAELMYLSTHDMEAKDIVENPEITAALKSLFSADVPPTPPVMAMLRMYGVKDWRSFKDVWDAKYATEVGMALYDSIREDIKLRVSTSPDAVPHVAKKKESLLKKFFTAGEEETHQSEDPSHKLERVSQEMLYNELAAQPNGERTWLSPDAMNKFAAEIAIALRKINIEISLGGMNLSNLDEKTRKARLAEVIGVAENQLDHVLGEQVQGKKKEYFLKKNAHRIIEEQIAGLDDRLGFTGASRTSERVGAANTDENIPLERAYRPDGDFDEEFVGLKRGELRGLVGQVGTRIEKISQFRTRFKDTWMDQGEVKDAMKLLSEEVAKLENYFKGTSTDKVLVEMAKSPAFRSVVEAAILEGLSYRAEMARAIESKNIAKKLQVIEGGLSKIEAEGRKKTSESKQHRQVIDALRRKKPGSNTGGKVAFGAAALALIGLTGIAKDPDAGKKPTASITRSAGNPDRGTSRPQRVELVQDGRSLGRTTIPEIRTQQRVRGELSSSEISGYLDSVLSTLDLPNGLNRMQVQSNLAQTLENTAPYVRNRFIAAVSPENGQGKDVLRAAINTLYPSGQTTPNMQALKTYLDSSFG